MNSYVAMQLHLRRNGNDYWRSFVSAYVAEENTQLSEEMLPSNWFQ
jgi:hypothetical protein